MSEVIGYIKTNDVPEGCDEAFERIRELIESSRVYAKTSAITGYVVSEEEPGESDREKLWLHVTECGAYWKYYSEECEGWALVNRPPGERLTRYRIENTVTEDISKYYGPGWVLADGTGDAPYDTDLTATGVTTKGVYDLTIPKQDLD